jgi:hypothetical protein
MLFLRETRILDLENFHILAGGPAFLYLENFSNTYRTPHIHPTTGTDPTNSRARPSSDERAACDKCVADVSVHCGQICESKGLVSIDRREITALLSTTPRLKTRSSTNDLAPQHCTVRYFFSHPAPRSAQESDRMLWLRHRGRRNRSARVYRCLRT